MTTAIITSTVNGVLMARVQTTDKENRTGPLWFRVTDMISVVALDNLPDRCSLQLCHNADPVLACHSADELIKALVRV